MTRREFLDAVGLALTGALAGFLTGRALVGEEVEDPLAHLEEGTTVAFLDADSPPMVDPKGWVVWREPWTGMWNVSPRNPPIFSSRL